MPSNETAIELFLLALEGRSAPGDRKDPGTQSAVRTAMGLHVSGSRLGSGRPRATKPGRPPNLPATEEASFKARFLADPTEADGVCTLRGKEAQRILKEEFGVEYTLAGGLRLAASLGAFLPGPATASSEKTIPSRCKSGSKMPPLLSRKSPKRTPKQRVEVWLQDETRIGQQGTLTRRWAPKGSRPTAVKQTEYEWVYLFGAVNPVTGDSSALLAPTVQHRVHESSSAIHQ